MMFELFIKVLASNTVMPVVFSILWRASVRALREVKGGTSATNPLSGAPVGCLKTRFITVVVLVIALLTSLLLTVSPAFGASYSSISVTENS